MCPHEDVNRAVGYAGEGMPSFGRIKDIRDTVERAEKEAKAKYERLVTLSKRWEKQ